ncbi:MAG: non-ribosomal peptide synthetase [Steroidobacteraceae bacterium]
MSILDYSAAAETLAQAFTAVARRQPSTVLLSYEEMQWTYEQMDRWSDVVAAQITDALPAPGVIGVSSNSPPLLLASYLGVLKAGHAYAGFDPSFPDERLTAMASVASLCAWLTDEEQYRRVRDRLRPNVPVIAASEADGPIRASTRRDPAPGDLSHVLFTSGSTGVPKAVPRKHAHILHNAWRHRALRIAPGDKLTLITRHGFWDAVSNPYNALLNGATICATRVFGGDRYSLADWIERERITVYYSLTTVFRQLLATRRPQDKLESLRLVYLGGERVDASDVQKCKAILRDRAEVAIGLAATETGITALKVRPVAELSSDAQPTVGAPLDGIDIEIRTEQGALAAPNVEGQIVFRSEYIFSGYLNAPTLAGATSRIHPDPQHPGRYVYESGDYGFFDRRGELIVIGRMDQQVKIRGFRVELGEIESTLRNSPGIADVAVVLNPGTEASANAEAAIVAFVVGREDLDLQQLRATLIARLPEYMVPARIWPLERIPRLPNGKIDRLGLANQDVEKQSERSALEINNGPVGELEQTVATLWSELLGVACVSRTDRFFQVGGNSLKALMFIFKLTERIGGELPYSLILEDDELRSFCARASELVAAG